MTTSERAARTMLGPLDDPTVAIGPLFDALFRRLDMLSDGEKVLADLALQIFNGGGTRTVADVLRWLDRENLVNFLRALAIVRPDEVAAVAAELPISA